MERHADDPLDDPRVRQRLDAFSHDASALQRLAGQVPGASAGTLWVTVSRMGFARRIAAPIRRVEPDELLAAFPAD